jgi:hypothetical protein
VTSKRDDDDELRFFVPTSSWRETSIDLRGSLRRRDDWLVVTGPGGRPRALEGGRSSPAALYVVPAFAAPDALVVGAVVDGAVAVARRGICSIAELVAQSRESGAYLEPNDAVDLLLRAGEPLSGHLDPARAEIDVDGAVISFRGDAPLRDASVPLATLVMLLAGRPDPAAALERLATVHTRATLERIFTAGPRWMPRGFMNRLRALDLDAPPPSRIGEMVRALFPERAAAEAAFAEEVAARPP